MGRVEGRLGERPEQATDGPLGEARAVVSDRQCQARLRGRDVEVDPPVRRAVGVLRGVGDEVGHHAFQ